MAIKSIKERPLEIDLTGPDGNVNFLMAQAKNLCEQFGREWEPVLDNMRSANYEHAIQVFEREFGEYVTLYR